MQPLLCDTLSLFTTTEERLRYANALFPENTMLIRPKLDAVLSKQNLLKEYFVRIEPFNQKAKERYFVTNKGRVFKLTGVFEYKLITPIVDEDGELMVILQEGGVKRQIYLAERVGMSFVIPSDEVMEHWPFRAEVIHLDGDRSNCDMTNLKWIVREPFQVELLESN